MKSKTLHRLTLLLAFCLAGMIVVDGIFAAGSRNRYREARLRMVREYIEAEGVDNRRVLKAMRGVPRHEFVPKRLRNKAYTDAAWPIGYRQTISPPFIVAYMTQTIDPKPHEKVLEIGTGSGYQAAVLSGLVKEVYTIEIVPQLGKSAARRLKKLGYDNVTAKVGDGYKGWARHAPFDKIIVTCSPENVPQPLIDQLKENGKMIIPLGKRYQQVFHLFEKQDGKLVRTKLIPTLFVPMTGISEEKRKLKPDPLNPKIVNGGFETDSNDDGLPDNWHYLRQVKLAGDDAPQGARYLRFKNSDPGRSSQALQGMAIDGRRVRALRVSLSMKLENTVTGLQSYEKPNLMIHFYDATRRPIGYKSAGPWIGSAKWQKQTVTIAVPKAAREAVIRVGLNGATGLFCVDEVVLSAKGGK